jgi:hypothetical protein
MKNYTDITLLIDRSGSMCTIKDAMDEAINGFIESQKEADGEATISIYSFDTARISAPSDKYATGMQITEHCVGVALEDAPYFAVEPRGGTPLWDAQNDVISRTGERLAAMHEEDRPEKVIFVTITDGEENSSKEVDGNMVAARVKEQKEKYNWMFIYLGADQDAIAEGGKFGVAAGASLGYAKSAVGTHKMSKTLDSKVKALRGMSMCDYSESVECSAVFDEEDREENADH